MSLMVALALSLALTGCQVAKSAFKDEASTVSANFAAAATTLQYLHEGKLTRQYARATFYSYATVMKGADGSLERASGAPDQPTLNHLLQLYEPAAQAVNDPCLDSQCDWRGQVAALQTAGNAFRQAGKA